MLSLSRLTTLVMIYIHIYIIFIVVLIFNSEVYLNIQSLPQIRKESYTEFGLHGNTCTRGGFGVSFSKQEAYVLSTRKSEEKRMVISIFMKDKYQKV